MNKFSPDGGTWGPEARKVDEALAAASPSSPVRFYRNADGSYHYSAGFDQVGWIRKTTDHPGYYGLVWVHTAPDGDETIHETLAEAKADARGEA